MGCLKINYHYCTEPKMFIVVNNLTSKESENKLRSCYVFGALLPGRNWNAAGENYAFGFNGQLQDDEIYGEGNSYTAENWEYDPRLGRRWNLDPYTDYSFSSYATFKNNPIFFVDPSGAVAGDYYTKEGKHLGSDGIKDDKVYIVGGDTKDFSAQRYGNSGSTSKIGTFGVTSMSSSNGSISANTSYQEPANDASPNAAYTVTGTNISQKTLVRFASAIYQESSASAPMKESYAIASVFVNYVNDVNQKGYTLDGVVSRANHFSYGVEKGFFNQYMKLFNNGKGNNRNALGAALNALTGGTDYSNGAIFWDGGDLVHLDFNNANYWNSNSHRSAGIYATPELLNGFNSHYESRYGECFIKLESKPSAAGKYYYKATAVHGGTIFFKQYDGYKGGKRGFKSSASF